MKCPHADCRKDFNPDWWVEEITIPKEYLKEIDEYKDNLRIETTRQMWNLFGWGWRIAREAVMTPKNLNQDDKLKIQIFQCKHCYRYFYEIFSVKFWKNWEISEEKTIFEFPSSKIKFKSNNIPNEIVNYFQEAQRCRAVWSLIWASACLRKAVYALCDLTWTDWEDYTEKIKKLPIKDIALTDFLTHIKWLWDDMVHSIWDEKYSKNEIDSVFEVLPFVIEDIYKNNEDIEQLNKALQKIRSNNSPKT